MDDDPTNAETKDSPIANGDTDIELVMVTMTFDAADADGLLATLSKYVVVSRGHTGCRNMDLGASTTVVGRFVVIQKWDSIEAQQRHFDSKTMIEMAQSCQGLLTEAPTIDLIEPISAHDLA